VSFSKSRPGLQATNGYDLNWGRAAGAARVGRVVAMLLALAMSRCGNATRVAPRPSSDAGTAGSSAASAISPSVSLAWSWAECGRIARDPSSSAGHVTSLALSADGTFLASDLEGLTTGWSVAPDFAQSTPLWKIGGEGN